MKQGSGKAKGGDFERLVCKRLSLWVSHGAAVDLFWRSSMSGGRATVHHRKGVNVRQAGDICAVSPEGHSLTDNWFIECKHLKNVMWDRFILLGQGPLMPIWRTAVQQARRHHRKPLLIVRQNQMPIFCVARSFAGLYYPGSGIPPDSLSTMDGKCNIVPFDHLLRMKYAGENE